ncbi:MAG: hypothetical protein ACFFCS_05855 [Candidatus Hodarchaeota archaeon]
MDVKNLFRSPGFDMLLRFVCLIQISFFVAVDIHNNYLTVYDDLTFGLASILSFMLAGYALATILYIVANNRVLLDSIALAAFLASWIVANLVDLDARATIISLALMTGIFSFYLGGFDNDSRFLLQREAPGFKLKPDILVPVALVSGILLHTGIDPEYQQIHEWVAFWVLVGITAARAVMAMLKMNGLRILASMPKSKRLKRAFHVANWWRVIILILSIVLIVVAFIEQLFFDILRLLIETDAAIYIYPGYQLYSIALYAVLAGTVSGILLVNYVVQPMKKRWARNMVGLMLFQATIAYGLASTVLLGEMSLVAPTVFVFFHAVSLGLVYLILNSGKRGNPSVKTLEVPVQRKKPVGEKHAKI